MTVLISLLVGWASVQLMELAFPDAPRWARTSMALLFAITMAVLATYIRYGHA